MLSLNIKYDIKWPAELLERRTQYMIDTTGNEIVNSIKKNIMLQRSIYGGRLAPLKPDTIRRKRKKGLRYPKMALRASSILYKSIHYYTGRGDNKGTVGIIDRGLPSRKYLAYIHQFGLFKGGIARPFFGISKDCDARVRSMWRGWFLRLTGKWKTFKAGIV